MRHRIPTRGGPPDTTTPGHIEADTVAHCGDTTAGNFVYSLTFTDLYSGWTELRAIWNKSGQAIRDHLQDIEAKAPFTLKSFHADNGSEFLNWPLYEYLTGRRWNRVPFTRSRAYRKNDNAHVEQKNWTHVRQLFGHDRFEHAQLVPMMNDLYAQEWSQFQNHFRPSLKLHSGPMSLRLCVREPISPAPARPVLEFRPAVSVSPVLWNFTLTILLTPCSSIVTP